MQTNVKHPEDDGDSGNDDDGWTGDCDEKKCKRNSPIGFSYLLGKRFGLEDFYYCVDDGAVDDIDPKINENTL